MKEPGFEKNKPEVAHQCVCPWWICFSFDNFIRRHFQNPDSILKPYIVPGWTVLDVGPGMGYFTIPLARLVGKSGKVIAADLQKGMLDGISRRAIKVGVQDRIILHQVKPDKIGINEAVDFCLAFWMAHEVPDRDRFFREIAFLLKPGGLLLMAEPKIHVSSKSFRNSVASIQKAGLSEIDRPRIYFSYSGVFKKMS